MYYYDFGDTKKILLEFHTKEGKLPPLCEEKYVFFKLNLCRIYSQIYLIAGKKETFGLGICFAQGKKDAYAAIIVLYINGEGYAYYPWDAEWLSVFDIVSVYASNDLVLQTLSQVMQHVVGRDAVYESDFAFVRELLKPYVKYKPKIYWSMFYWTVWFLYACVAEERYVSYSGNPTLFGGLIKIVAWIEHAYEGWSVKDACDHYKAECYKSVYHGTYALPSYEVIDKCLWYGIERKI